MCEEKHFRSTRTVQRFQDGSELLFLPDSNGYVWQRLEDYKSKFREIAILADSDEAALQEVKSLAEREFMGGFGI